MPRPWRPRSSALWRCASWALPRRRDADLRLDGRRVPVRRAVVRRHRVVSPLEPRAGRGRGRLPVLRLHRPPDASTSCVLAVAAAVLFGLLNLRDSKTGRAFRGPGSEMAAASLGIDVVRTKLFAFASRGSSPASPATSARPPGDDRPGAVLAARVAAVPRHRGRRRARSLGGAVGVLLFAALRAVLPGAERSGSTCSSSRPCCWRCILLVYPRASRAWAVRRPSWRTASTARSRRSSTRPRRHSAGRAPDRERLRRAWPRGASRRGTALQTLSRLRAAAACDPSAARPSAPAARRSPAAVRPRTRASAPPRRRRARVARGRRRHGPRSEGSPPSTTRRSQSAGPDRRPHRAERRRQDHALQRDLRTERSDGGRIRLFGEDVTALPVHEPRRVRPRPHLPGHPALPRLTVFENLLVATHLHNASGPLANRRDAQRPCVSRARRRRRAARSCASRARGRRRSPCRRAAVRRRCAWSSMTTARR